MYTKIVLTLFSNGKGGDSSWTLVKLFVIGVLEVEEC